MVDSKDERPIALRYNEPDSVGRLKKSYRGKLTLPDAQVFLGELMNESDRAAIILASSMLDDLLANAIAMKMNPKMLVSDVDKVFRPNGPLGSFAARIEIASLFQIIDDTTFVQLSTLLQMRNACAHSKHPILLTDELLENVAKHFFKGSHIETALPALPLKLAFCIEVTFLAMVLSQGSRYKAAHLRVQALKDAVASGMPFAEALTQYMLNKT